MAAAGRNAAATVVAIAAIIVVVLAILAVCPRPTGPIYAVGPYTLEKEKNGMCFDN
jgi:hypothetical protein